HSASLHTRECPFRPARLQFHQSRRLHLRRSTPQRSVLRLRAGQLLEWPASRFPQASPELLPMAPPVAAPVAVPSGALVFFSTAKSFVPLFPGKSTETSVSRNPSLRRASTAYSTSA